MKKILSVLLAVIVLATFAFFAVGSSDDSSASVSQGEGVTDGNKTEESKPLTVKVGDVLTTDSLKITYADCGVYTDYNEYMGPEKGNKIVYLKLEAENIGSTDTYLSMFEFSCYADDVAMDEYIYGDNLFSSDAISSGRKMSGYMYFEVPKDAEKIEVEYETDYWTSNKAIFVVE